MKSNKSVEMEMIQNHPILKDQWLSNVSIILVFTVPMCSALITVCTAIFTVLMGVSKKSMKARNVSPPFKMLPKLRKMLRQKNKSPLIYLQYMEEPYSNIHQGLKVLPVISKFASCVFNFSRFSEWMHKHPGGNSNVVCKFSSWWIKWI